MAKFVLAGKADCPHYAKAELLADRLQRSLPDFRIHKISILPHEWRKWLEATCNRNGWKHERSPLVWRELVNQGGKGMLLGGFSDFLEHCQDYYSITSDMLTDSMLAVAAENLESKMNIIAEEQRCLNLNKPLHIWITSALNPTCNFLIPNLLSAEVFPHVSTISLHLLDLEGNAEGLQGLRMETEDLALHLLHQVTIHTDLDQAFQEADVILLLDEWWSDDNDEEEQRKKKVKAMSDRYIEYGQLIDTRANKEVKVIVSAGSFANLRCSLLLDNARSIDSHQFITMATQLENEAKAILAKKLKVRTSDIRDVIVWGNISGSFYIDLQWTKVFNYDGAIKGPAFFSQPALKLLHERFATTVNQCVAPGMYAREAGNFFPLFEEMVGDRPSRLGTLSACGFNVLPSSFHVGRRRDPRRPERLELQRRWGLLRGCPVPRRLQSPRWHCPLPPSEFHRRQVGRAVRRGHRRRVEGETSVLCNGAIAGKRTWIQRRQ